MALDGRAWSNWGKELERAPVVSIVMMLFTLMG